MSERLKGRRACEEAFQAFRLSKTRVKEEAFQAFRLSKTRVKEEAFQAFRLSKTRVKQVLSPLNQAPFFLLPPEVALQKRALVTPGVLVQAMYCGFL